MQENAQLDKKSLKAITGKNPDWDEIAKDCVAFANAYGGKLLFGIEDNADQPDDKQKIPENLPGKVVKQIQQRTINTSVVPQVKKYENGGEVLEMTIQRSDMSIAGTTSGKYFMRVSDQSKPLLPDELSRLMNDKNAYVWETQTYLKIAKNDYDPQKLSNFVKDIKSSSRISSFVKEKSTEELLDYYLFTSNDLLTNLGILWIGKRQHRARLLYAPSIQFIKYDENENKVRKMLWDDYSLNPKEMIDQIWNNIPEWQESIEIADGIFRKHVPNYDEVVVRELLANAIVHRPYNTRGDIFINLFTDRLEVHNPGLFPLGVTPKNILHKSVVRNPHLAKVFYDLKLMEKEGSGYDRMYGVLLAGGKALPEPNEADDRVWVVVRKRIVNKNVINFMDKVQREFQLSSKEWISLGLIAQHNSLTALEFADKLELNQPNNIRDWLGNLMDMKLVQSKGRTKGTVYFVSPELLNKLDFKGVTNLKKIEMHRLKALIIEDLSIYNGSSISDIHQRIGKEIPRRTIRFALQNLLDENTIKKEGENRWTKYFY